jgi:acyl carrier protein
MSDTERKIRSLLSRDGRAHAIAASDDLLAAGLLDSVGVLALIAGLERAFRLKIDTKHVTEDNFGSIRAIVALIRRLTTGEEA